MFYPGAGSFHRNASSSYQWVLSLVNHFTHYCFSCMWSVNIWQSSRRKFVSSPEHRQFYNFRTLLVIGQWEEQRRMTYRKSELFSCISHQAWREDKDIPISCVHAYMYMLWFDRLGGKAMDLMQGFIYDALKFSSPYFWSIIVDLPIWLKIKCW